MVCTRAFNSSGPQGPEQKAGDGVEVNTKWRMVDWQKRPTVRRRKHRCWQLFWIVPQKRRVPHLFPPEDLDVKYEKQVFWIGGVDAFDRCRNFRLARHTDTWNNSQTKSLKRYFYPRCPYIMLGMVSMRMGSVVWPHMHIRGPSDARYALQDWKTLILRL